MCSDFLDRINEILKENMTKEGFNLWKNIQEKTPMVFHRPSSSSGKYHQDESGVTRSIGEHTFQIIYSSVKIMKIFNVLPNTKQADVLLLSAACHDLVKYGCEDALHRKSTEPKHDKLIADTLLFNRDRFLECLNEGEFKKLEQICRYHTGRWSTDADTSFSFCKLPMEVLFLHMLDVLSAENLLKIPEKLDVNTKNDTST